MANFFTFSPTNISSAVILFNLILVTAIALYIAWIYRRTHTGLSYSQSFFITLVMVSPIAMVVIMVVQNNIYGALGLLGAFALIRFRTIVKETRDISFLFFSLVEGVAVGAGHYSIAIISTIFISAIVILLAKFKFGAVSDNKHLLMLNTDNPIDEDKIKDIAKSFGLAMELLSAKKIEDEYEYTYSTQIKDISLLQKFLSDLARDIPLKNYDLISGRDTVEY